MNQSFEKYSKYFFWIAGVVTISGPLIVLLRPFDGLQLTIGLTYIDQSPQLFPVIGHWGIMVAGMGVLLFMSAKTKAIRKSTVLFSTIEKAYMVMMALYCMYTKQPFASNYYFALIADSSMVVGGLWYLIRSYQLKQV